MVWKGYNPEWEGWNPEWEGWNPEWEGWNPELKGWRSAEDNSKVILWHQNLRKDSKILKEVVFQTALNGMFKTIQVLVTVSSYSHP